jgi:hypothetical protein
LHQIQLPVLSVMLPILEQLFSFLGPLHPLFDDIHHFLWHPPETWLFSAFFPPFSVSVLQLPVVFSEQQEQPSLPLTGILAMQQ